MQTIDQTTRLIKPGATPQEHAYPVYMSDVRKQNTSWSFTEPQDIEPINALGYFAVASTERPISDEGHVVEVTPVLVDGVWTQAWDIQPFSEEEIAAQFASLKGARLTDISSKVTAALAKGFPFTFSVGVGHVQLRDGDRANLAGARVRAEAHVVAGEVDELMPFRDFENKTHWITPAEMVQLADGAYSAYLGFLAVGWGLKDLTEAALTAEDLPEVPTELTLPSA